MFERRLRIVLTFPVLCLLAVILRLAQLQILHGEDYDQKADAALISPRQYLPPLRGAIKDRLGQVLVSDEPAIDVTVHYGALAMNDSYVLLLANRIRKKEPAWSSATPAEGLEEARRRIGEMWTTLQTLSGRSLKELRDQRDAVCQSVERLRDYLWSARRDKGFDDTKQKLRLREEEMFHPILRDISPEARTRIELELTRWPFVRIEPSVRRVWHDGSQPMCHILGQIGPISPERIANDPGRDDPLAAYRADDDAGISGVERVSEAMLRGQRGFEEKDLDKNLRTRQSPKDGLDVQLTIDLGLQSQVERILSEVVTAHPASTGASAVVLDVESREILAAVSVPTYDRTALREDYKRLRDDAKSQPLRFRAVQDRYQPGSIIKPVALLSAFANDLFTPETRVNCVGALIPGATKWHCWTHWRGMPGHGDMIAEEALQHSCNVYFYTLGQRVGAHRLTEFYRDFILGPADRLQPLAERGTQLIEESRGLIPLRDWLKEHRHRAFSDADGRNYAIGQGEIQITPLQAANMFATLASGVYRDPTLVANDGRPRPPVAFPKVSPQAWQIMRKGLYRCVNEEGGTAFKYAHMNELQICGKTGSAECVPRIIERRYTFNVPIGEGTTETRSIEAPTIEAAREWLGIPTSVACISREITRRWPEAETAKVESVGPDGAGAKIPTHAWFAGFAPYHQPRVAVAVIIEFGGGGGSTAGPAAKAIFEALLASPRGYLAAERMAGVSP
ncbi:MAG: penicillin-binding transpeptidase domain-containing protein [Planctomycetota bacterium]